MRTSAQNLLFELLFDDDQVAAAEQLYLSGAVVEVLPLESQLFTAKVRDGIVYETEIQNPFTKKQKSTCECVFFNEHGFCKHIIATLYELREIYRYKKEEKDKSKPQQENKKPGSLTITHILQEADHEELVSFIKNYARTDRKFAMQLKVHFARQIELADNTLKYREILNTLVKPHTGAGSKASASDVRNICHILADFGSQADDCLAIGQFQEAYDIMEASFTKLEYVRHHYPIQTDSTERLSVEYHQRFKNFLSEKIPPDLRKKLHDFGKDLASRSYYHFTHIHSNLLRILLEEKDKRLQAEIKTLIQDLLKRKSDKESAILYPLLIFIQNSVKSSDIEFIKDKNLKLTEVSDNLLALNKNELAIALLELYKGKFASDKELIQRLISLHSANKNQQAIFGLVCEVLLMTEDLRYLDLITKETEEEGKTILMHEVEHYLTEHNASDKLLSKFYKKVNFIDQLGSMIIRKNDFQLLREHSEYLYKHNRVNLLAIYEILIFHYLNEHLGDMSVSFVKDTLGFLNSEKLDFVSEGLKKFLLTHFSHRPVLTEILK